MKHSCCSILSGGNKKPHALFLSFIKVISAVCDPDNEKSLLNQPQHFNNNLNLHTIHDDEGSGNLDDIIQMTNKITHMMFSEEIMSRLMNAATKKKSDQTVPEEKIKLI